eukprot:9501852-Pyramimonas_sp.AAC.2
MRPAGTNHTRTKNARAPAIRSAAHAPSVWFSRHIRSPLILHERGIPSPDWLPVREYACSSYAIGSCSLRRGCRSAVSLGSSANTWVVAT